MSEGFDLQKVRGDAQRELVTLTTKEEEILSELEKVRADKSEIEEFLGLNPKASGTKRNRYRTKVKNYFEGVDSSEEVISVDAAGLLDELFDSDDSMLSGLKVSMARLGREDDRYSYNSETHTLIYTTPSK